MSLLYIACLRDQHSAFPIASLISVWCALCGESVCASTTVSSDNETMVCRRALFHEDSHRDGDIQWPLVMGARIVSP